jgi:hypothetical protein
MLTEMPIKKYQEYKLVVRKAGQANTISADSFTLWWDDSCLKTCDFTMRNVAESEVSFPLTQEMASDLVLALKDFLKSTNLVLQNLAPKPSEFQYHAELSKSIER